MNHLKYAALLKTAELGSITRAAEALGYTQSAISRTIAELEREFDLPLLTRNRSGAVLTAEGALLLPYLQQVCNACQGCEGTGRRAPWADQGRAPSRYADQHLSPLAARDYEDIFGPISRDPLSVDEQHGVYPN